MEAVGSIAALLKATKSVPGILGDPEPALFLAGLGASSVDWQVRAWSKTEDYRTVFQGIVEAVKKVLDREKIGIPYPQMDVYFDVPTESVPRSPRTPEANA